MPPEVAGCPSKLTPECIDGPVAGCWRLVGQRPPVAIIHGHIDCPDCPRGGGVVDCPALNETMPSVAQPPLKLGSRQVCRAPAMGADNPAATAKAAISTAALRPAMVSLPVAILLQALSRGRNHGHADTTTTASGPSGVPCAIALLSAS